MKLLVQPIKQDKFVADGLEYVLGRMDWFISLSRAVTRNDWPANHPFKAHQKSAQTEIVKLFKGMLKFEMECACRAYAKHPVVQMVTDMLQLDDWESKLSAMKDLDERISDDLRQYRLSELTEYSSQVATNTEDLLVEVRQIRLLVADDKRQHLVQKLPRVISRFGATTYLEQMRLNPKNHPGTCKWFREHAKYKAWLRSDRNDLLLATAEPGCGKSVLSRFLIERNLPSQRPGGIKPIVCYFFFKENPTQSRLKNALGCVIHQLLVKIDETAAQYANEIASMTDEMLEGLDTLWGILERVSEDRVIEGRTIYCVFDALDECDEKDRAKLVSLLDEYLQGEGRIRFLITSRPNPNVVSAFRKWSEKPVRLEGEGDKEKDELQKEIEIVFRYQIKGLVDSRDLSDAVSDLLHEKLLAKGAGQRTYLWMRLVFELLDKETPMDLRTWEILLDALPQDAFEAYDKLLSNVSDSYRENVLLLLKVIYIASEPLSLRQANLAIHIRGRYSEPSFVPLGLDDKSFRTWMQKECGFFITEYDGRLYFIHQTVREFLRGSRSATADDDASEKIVEFHQHWQDQSDDDESIASYNDPSRTSTPIPDPVSDKTAKTIYPSSDTTGTAKTWKNSIKSAAKTHLLMAECCLACIMITWRHPEVQQALTQAEVTYYAFEVPFRSRRRYSLDSNNSRDGDIKDQFQSTHNNLVNVAQGVSHEFCDYSARNLLFHANKVQHSRRSGKGIPFDAHLPTGLSLDFISAFDQFWGQPTMRTLLFLDVPLSEWASTFDRDMMHFLERIQDKLVRNLQTTKSASLDKLQTRLEEARQVTTYRCTGLGRYLGSAFRWDPGKSPIARAVKEGNLDEVLHVSPNCGHSEELEIFLAMTSFLCDSWDETEPSRVPSMTALLECQERKLAEDPKTREEFLYLLRYIAVGSWDAKNQKVLVDRQKKRLDAFIVSKAEKWSPDLLAFKNICDDFYTSGAYSAELEAEASAIKHWQQRRSSTSFSAADDADLDNTHPRPDVTL